jgi:hypothetical protein
LTREDMMDATEWNKRRCALNRKVCGALIGSLKKHGWVATKADEENISKLSRKAQVEMIHELDGANIVFVKGNRRHAVVFCPYNAGIECVVDWGYTEGDPDSFGQLMDQFCDRHGEDLMPAEPA